MKIGEFLKHPHQHLVICMPDHSLVAVAQLLHANGIGAMPVCELGTRMVGIVSERDLVRTFATTEWSELPHLRVRDIMTTRVMSCGPDDSMQTAQDLMIRNNFRHVPVVDGAKVVGIISIGDLVKFTSEQRNVELRYLTEYIGAH